MRDVVTRYLTNTISRRGFLDNLKLAGMTVTAAEGVLSSLSVAAQNTTSSSNSTANEVPPVKTFHGSGGACFAEQLMACGVKYVFGNSASEDAQFYDALVDRPQLVISKHPKSLLSSCKLEQ